MINKEFGLGLVIIFPVASAFLFALSYLLHQYIYAENGGSVFTRRQFYLYALFLSILFFIILFVSIRTGISEDVIGVLPRINLHTLLLISISIALGFLIYSVECKVSVYLASLLKKILKGRCIKEFSSTNSRSGGGIYAWIILSVVISIFEEFIWRGFLIITLVDELGFSLLNGVLISSFLFGINHYYFGVQSVFLKMISGFILGSLFIGTPSLLYPIIAHTIFNIIVYRKLNSCKNT